MVGCGRPGLGNTRTASVAASRLLMSARTSPRTGRRFVDAGGVMSSPRLEATMDGSRFDSLTRLVSQASSRRNTLRSALGAAAASTVAVVGLTALSSETDAQNRNRNRNRNNNRNRNRRRRCERCRPRAAGETCTTNEQCCTDKTNRICAQAPGTGGTTICCGGTGASCTSTAQCCRHFSCVFGFCRM